MINQTPAKSGHIPTETGPTSGVEELWRLEVAGDYASAPVVADGTVYVRSGRGFIPDAIHALSLPDVEDEVDEVLAFWERTVEA